MKKRKKINFGTTNIGAERRQDWADYIHCYSGYLPKSVLIKDIDTEFINMVQKDLSPIVKQKKYEGVVEEPMPVIFLTAQRWAEFTKTYDLTINELKDITLPFITVIRNTDVQVGTMQNGNYNIAGERTYIYLKVPTNDNGRNGIDLYKIPQPTSVDLTYQVRVFTTKINDQNSASELIHTQFNTLQKYIFPNEHPMPVKFESVSDESEMDLEEKKMYITTFEFVVQGYILNEDDFEVVSTPNRVTQSFEVNLSKSKGIKKITKTNLVLYDPKEYLVTGIITIPDESLNDRHYKGLEYRLPVHSIIYNGTIAEFCSGFGSIYDKCEDLKNNQ